MKKRPKYLPQAEMSYEEIADILGTTRANVADTEKRALKKLRIELAKRGLTLEDFFTWEKK